GLAVALLALVAELAAVGVVLGVARRRAAVLGRAVVGALRVAVLALGRGLVQPLERPVGVGGVVEGQRGPLAGDVAARALLAEGAPVQRVLVAAHAALLGSVLEAL